MKAMEAGGERFANSDPAYRVRVLEDRMAGAFWKQRRASEPAPQAFLALDPFGALGRAVSTSSVEAARTVAYFVTIGWWNALVERSGPIAAVPYAGSMSDIAGDSRELAGSIGTDLSRQPVEQAAAEIGRLYCSLLPARHRSSHGVFYTPRPLVSRLLDGAEAAGQDWTTGKVIDPSCGAGGFLIEAADRMITALGPAEPAIVVASVSARLRGWDLDPFAAWLAHVGVEALLLPQVTASGKRLAAITEARDSLAGWERQAGEFALVMGNPALGKMKDNPSIRGRFGRSLFGHPYRYSISRVHGDQRWAQARHDRLYRGQQTSDHSLKLPDRWSRVVSGGVASNSAMSDSHWRDVRPSPPGQ